MSLGLVAGLIGLPVWAKVVIIGGCVVIAFAQLKMEIAADKAEEATRQVERQGVFDGEA